MGNNSEVKIKDPSVKSKKSYQTRLLIMKSFIDLMKETDLTNITVKSICAQANITRGTFYLYFSDISELTEYIEETLLTEFPILEIPEKVRCITDYPTFDECKPTEWEMSLFDYYDKYHEAFNTLLGPHGDMRFYSKVKNRVQTELQKSMKIDGFPNDSYRKYFESVIPDIFLILSREWTGNSEIKDLSLQSLAAILSMMRVGSCYRMAVQSRLDRGLPLE